MTYLSIVKNILKKFFFNLCRNKIILKLVCNFYVPINVYKNISSFFINNSEISKANRILEIAFEDKRIYGFEDHLTSIYYLQGEYRKSIELMKRSESFRYQSLLRFVDVKPKFRIFTSKIFSPIGHIGLLDIYIKASILGKFGDVGLTLLGPLDRYSNTSLIEYWSKYLDIIDKPESLGLQPDLIETIEERISLIRSKVELFTLAEFGAEVQQEWEKKGFDGLLSLSQDHIEEGQKALESLGMPKDSWFCGIHVREGSERLTDARNASIDSYYLAIDEIISRGGWVIRMGDKSMIKLPYKYGVIDLPFTEFNLDWMNLFVWSQGRFLIGTGSGPVVLPLCFGKGVAIANWAPLASRQWGSKDILLPKHYYHIRENRYLCPEERMSEKYGYIESKTALRNMGIEVHDNSPDEIKELIIQMINSLTDSVKISEHQSRIQDRFDILAYALRIYPSKIAHVFSNKYI